MVAKASHEERMRRFAVPGLSSLDNTNAKIKLDGPVQAHKFMLLWENMLCRLVPARLDRLEVRAGLEESSRLSTEQLSNFARHAPAESALTSGLHLPQRVPDSTWQSLYMQTSVCLPFQVHACLWAPFCDPETGTLPQTDDMHHHITSLIPPDVLCKPMTNSQLSFFRAVFGLTHPHERWMGPKVDLSLEAPAWVHRDGEGLAHSHDGPAAVWRDGSWVYLWRGLQAPTAWFKAPTEEWLAERPQCPVPLPREEPYALPTPQDALQHTNVELRRVACEILGYDAVISSLNPVVINADPDPTIGTLLRVEMPAPTVWDPHATATHQFLRVQCGTGRQFSLAVPMEMSTARQANAWTYGLDESEYAPEVRT